MKIMQRGSLMLIRSITVAVIWKGFLKIVQSPCELEILYKKSLRPIFRNVSRSLWSEGISWSLYEEGEFKLTELDEALFRRFADPVFEELSWRWIVNSSQTKCAKDISEWYFKNITDVKSFLQIFLKRFP